jgi:DNA-binding protein H-NS
MSTDALFKLRDQVAVAIADKIKALKAELHALGEDQSRPERKKPGRSALKGRKVPAKYRGPKTGEVWSGRGATPRWLVAYEKQGKKRDQFLITKGAKKHKGKR